MNAKEILIAARAKIQDRARWTQQAFARDENGDYVTSLSEHAVCWCALGAIDAVSANCSIEARTAADNAVCIGARAVGAGGNVAAVNDFLGHSAVMDMFDIAIKEVDK